MKLWLLPFVLLPIFGAGLSVGLVLLTDVVARAWVIPARYESMVYWAYDGLPLFLPMIAGIIMAIIRQNKATAVLVAAGAAFGFSCAVLSLTGPLFTSYLRGPKDANTVVFFGPPGFVADVDGKRLLFTHLTAEYLNEVKFGRPYIEVEFVPREVASSGPFVVSVNPISDYTYGIAALSRASRCYVKVTIVDPNDTRFGSSRSGQLSLPLPCAGQYATPDSPFVVWSEPGGSLFQQ